MNTYLPRIAVATLAWLLLAPPVGAKPAHKKALADYFGPFLPRKLNDCRACHLPDQAGQEDDKPHNRFGARLKAVRKELGKAGKPTDVAACLDAIADEDADGDGVSNLNELLAGSNPGEAEDKPSTAELDAVTQKLPAFRKYRNGYPWRPFQTVQRPAVPQVKNTAWVRNPIDAFIAAEHEERGLKPRPEAPRPILLRRVYLDLIGLPPTREELQAALDDASPDWYEKVVDRLLASPRHGERWGRHWMDVWRYSDWYGYNGEIRHSQPHVWRWRDWIVDAVNADKGYDRMIQEMLAGDELAPDDPQVVRATGYLVRNYNRYHRDKWLQETVDHTFQGFLGLTIGCARCHDHMYDPLSQKEYYQVRAFFEPHRVRIDKMPGTLPPLQFMDTAAYQVPGDGLARAYDADLNTPTYLYDRGEETKPDKSKPLQPGVPAALGGRLPEIAPVPLPRAAYEPDRRAFVVQELVDNAKSTTGKAQAALRQARPEAAIAAALGQGELLPRLASLNAAQKALDVLAAAELEAALAAAREAALLAVLKVEALEEAEQHGTDEWIAACKSATAAERQQAEVEARQALQRVRQLHQAAATPAARAEIARRVDAAEKAVRAAQEKLLEKPSTAYRGRQTRTYPEASSGRRLALARWIADRDNPLTARVAMNHLWLRHFGQALAPQVFDFGRNGAAPTHPALLDWLAAEFMARGGPESPGWSMKRMHRLMVTSAAYRMASTTHAGNAALDRDNVYYWRMPSRRMEAEVVRDTHFHLSGTLDPTMGGPDIDYTKGLTVPRRSLYFRHAQEHQMEFLKIFDTASVVECYQRTTSVVPQQALALANSELTVRHARLAARALHGKVGPEPEAFVQAAYAQVLSRPPSAEELAECVAFLQEQAKLFGPVRNGAAAADERSPSPDPVLRARENLVRILFNHHDFVTIR